MSSPFVVLMTLVHTCLGLKASGHARLESMHNGLFQTHVLQMYVHTLCPHIFT